MKAAMQMFRLQRFEPFPHRVVRKRLKYINITTTCSGNLRKMSQKLQMDFQ
jgi:hypothetical protein